MPRVNPVPYLDLRDLRSLLKPRQYGILIIHCGRLAAYSTNHSVCHLQMQQAAHSANAQITGINHSDEGIQKLIMLGLVPPINRP